MQQGKEQLLPKIISFSKYCSLIEDHAFLEAYRAH